MVASHPQACHAVADPVSAVVDCLLASSSGGSSSSTSPETVSAYTALDSVPEAKRLMTEDAPKIRPIDARLTKAVDVAVSAPRCVQS